MAVGDIDIVLKEFSNLVKPPGPTQLAEETLSNINKLDGVGGLQDAIDHLELAAIAENTNDLLGAVYETTVARLVKDGEIAGSGALQEVAADTLELVDGTRLNTLNILTETQLIQAKGSSAAGNLTLSDLGRSTDGGIAYLDDMEAQADLIGRNPVLVSSAPLEAALDAAACARSIEPIVTNP